MGNKYSSVQKLIEFDVFCAVETWHEANNSPAVILSTPDVGTWWLNGVNE